MWRPDRVVASWFAQKRAERSHALQERRRLIVEAIQQAADQRVQVKKLTGEPFTHPGSPTVTSRRRHRQSA